MLNCIYIHIRVLLFDADSSKLSKTYQQNHTMMYKALQKKYVFDIQHIIHFVSMILIIFLVKKVTNNI